MTNSGDWPERTDDDVLTMAEQYTDSLIDNIGVADVPSTVVANAGVGKL